MSTDKDFRTLTVESLKALNDANSWLSAFAKSVDRSIKFDFKGVLIAMLPGMKTVYNEIGNVAEFSGASGNWGLQEAYANLRNTIEKIENALKE